MSHRDDLAAVVAVVAFIAQLIFAQFTLGLVLCFVIVGKLGRWRPLWLALPAVAGLAWILAIGVKPAVAGYLAWAGQLLRVLRHHGPLVAKVDGLRDLLASWRIWWPRQTPVALVVAAAQAAAILISPGHGTGRRDYRRGVVVLARCGYLTAILHRGELATGDGCCVGIATSTGTRAVISWQEAGSGVLCTGHDAGLVSATGQDLAIAAIQHRKTVIVIDLIGAAATVGIGDRIESECETVGAPWRHFDGRTTHYDPLSAARPARATSLVMAMIDWTGVAHAKQLFCANYLNAAFTVLEAGRRGARLDEILRLMSPEALRRQLSQLPGQHQANRPLIARVTELTAQLDVDPSILAPVAAQLAEFSSAISGRPRRSAIDESAISLTAALAGREVVVYSLGRGQLALMIARLVVADLIEHLAERSDLGSRADGLVWINGCEGIDRRQLAALVALGERTGTAVVLGTSIGSVAAGLTADVNVVAVRGDCPPALIAPGGEAGPPPSLPDGLAEVLAQAHAPGRADVLSFGVCQPRPRLVAACKAVW